MATTMKFGKCLSFLLSTSGISINRLSKAINVDSTLVNRWVNEKRIPPYNTNYIDNISEYLSKTINNSFQINHLNELFVEVCEASGTNVCIRDKIMKVLLETQGYSIECRKMEMKKDKAHAAKKERIYKALNNYQFGYEHGDNIKFEKLTDYMNPLHQTDLSKEDKIIDGSKDILTMAIFLLKAACGKKPGNNNTVCLSFINDFDLTSQSHDSLTYFKNILSAAINRGWNILCLLRLNSNINRTINFISFALPLIKTGKFNPYYFIRYDNLSTCNEFLVVPETGALIGLPAKADSEISHAFFFKSMAAVDIFYSHFNTLLSTFAQPLIKYYTLEENIEYEHFLIENENNIGNRFTYRYSLCISMLPEKLYKKLLKRKKLSYDEVLKASEYYKIEANAFLSNIPHYEYKDIYPMYSIIELVKYRRLCFHCHAEIEIMDLSAQEIIELLQNIIYMLETYDNYNIAFIPQSLDNTIEYADYSCIIKERQSLVFEAYMPPKIMPEVRLSIEEPILLKAFDEYFNRIWNRIAPENKNKKNVINWIQIQIDILRNNN